MIRHVLFSILVLLFAIFGYGSTVDFKDRPWIPYPKILDGMLYSTWNTAYFKKVIDSLGERMDPERLSHLWLRSIGFNFKPELLLVKFHSLIKPASDKISDTTKSQALFLFGHVIIQRLSVLCIAQICLGIISVFK